MSDVDSSEAETFTETTTVSWIGRIRQSIVGLGLGLLLIVSTVILLFCNENRSAQTARSLGEGEARVVEGDPARVDPANEGRLVHVSGDLKTSSPLTDPEFGVSAVAARLVRVVTMFQWEEERTKEVHRGLGGSEDTVTTYSYVQTWSTKRIDSGKFKHQAGHANPPMPYHGFEVSARDATLGAFRPDATALARLPANKGLHIKAAALTGGTAPARLVGGKLFIGADPNRPAIGDVRIRYRIAPNGPMSLIGRQTGSGFTEYQTRAGDRLLIASTGIKSAQDMFQQAEKQNRFQTWVFRIVGILFMLKGTYFTFRPLAVVADAIPVVGSLVRAGAGLAALLSTALLASLVIAAAWLWIHPAIGIGVLALGLGFAGLVLSLIGRRSAPASFAVRSPQLT